MNQWWLVYCRIYASLGLNEFMPKQHILVIPCYFCLQLIEPQWHICMHHYARTSLVQIMVHCLFGTRPLPEPMLSRCSVHENFEGIAGLRTSKTFKIAGAASLLQLFMVVTYDAFTKYCQSSRTCKYFILPVHPFYCQPGAEDLQFSRRLPFSCQLKP